MGCCQWNGEALRPSGSVALAAAPVQRHRRSRSLTETPNKSLRRMILGKWRLRPDFLPVVERAPKSYQGTALTTSSGDSCGY